MQNQKGEVQRQDDPRRQLGFTIYCLSYGLEVELAQFLNWQNPLWGRCELPAKAGYGLHQTTAHLKGWGQNLTRFESSKPELIRGSEVDKKF